MTKPAHSASRRRLTAAAIAGLVLAGCAGAPKYDKPLVDVAYVGSQSRHNTNFRPFSPGGRLPRTSASPLPLRLLRYQCS